MIPKDTGSDRRRFLGGLLATAAVLPGGALLAQGSDPDSNDRLWASQRAWASAYWCSQAARWSS